MINLATYDTDKTYPYISTFSGNKLHFNNPSPDEICIEDIINNLSNNCRYCGNVNQFYSVAEHSVLMADKVYEITGDLGKARTALMHDATEAYLCDIPRPMKPYLVGYHEMEKRLADVIFLKYDIQPMCEVVRHLDCNIVRDEAIVLFNRVPEWINDYELTGVEIKCWGPEDAKNHFRDCLHKYGIV